MLPLIVNRVHSHPDRVERWRVSCPHGSTAPIRFWWSAMHTDERILQAARQALRMAKHKDNPAHAREIVMGSRYPQD